MDDLFQQAPPKAFEPDPSEWLSQERLERLESELLSARHTLAIGGLLPRALQMWVRQQIAEEAPWSAEERDQSISERRVDWITNNDFVKMGLRESEVSRKLSIFPGCESWVNKMWGHRVETLFLQRKDELDEASCRLLLLEDKALAFELFYRIKAGEESFDILARRFSQGPERSNGGLISLKPLAYMPMGLGKLLPRMVPMELRQPIRMGEFIGLIQLEDWKPSQLDASTKKKLLLDELSTWVDSVVELAIAHLMCAHNFEVVPQ